MMLPDDGLTLLLGMLHPYLSGAVVAKAMHFINGPARLPQYLLPYDLHGLAESGIHHQHLTCIQIGYVHANAHRIYKRASCLSLRLVSFS